MPRCRAAGCHEQHSTHRCRICLSEDSSHRSRDCPRQPSLVMTLFHETDIASYGAIIRGGGLQPSGSNNLIGKAIYFTDDHRLTVGKARRHGVIIACQVRPGRVKLMPDRGGSSLTRERLQREGYDSAMCHRGGKTEYAIYDPSRVTIGSLLPGTEQGFPFIRLFGFDGIGVTPPPGNMGLQWRIENGQYTRPVLTPGSRIPAGFPPGPQGR
mmetsp:Transcript_11675/g.28074  ORF Transcript_11675/g.28074 Transcript_11675/m.28074 type:complete len:212 (-) Transcript_11675:552-1187(-)